LDRIEFSREFGAGEFHFADLYVVNHKQDNIIKFKPRSTGTFKFLVQQPEEEEAINGEPEAPFDLEVGVYDPSEQKFLSSGMNRHLSLSGDRHIKLEYAQVHFEVGTQHLNRPLYVFFRALNFTDDGAGHRASEGCLALFIEAEFREDSGKCKNNHALVPSTDIVSLGDLSQKQVILAGGNNAGTQGAEHSITDPFNTFFTYQDFYLMEGHDREADREVTISLQQKFIEKNTLDIFVEVLDSDVALNEIKKDDHSPKAQSIAPHGLAGSRHDFSGGQKIQGQYEPTCKDICLIGGEKTFNEMQRVIELPPQTYFRVWLFQ